MKIVSDETAKNTGDIAHDKDYDEKPLKTPHDIEEKMSEFDRRRK